MRQTIVVAFSALTLLAPSRSAAQARRSFEDLALGVNLGDRIRVEDQSGVKATGRLTGLTRDEIAIQTDAGEKRFASNTVREVAVRGHSLRKGALIGAAVLAAVGAATVCAHDGGGACAGVGALGAAPIGAGLGLTIGALVPRMKTVYRAPETGAAVPAPQAARGVRASLLEDLGLRVNLDDELRVNDGLGAAITGRLTQLTAGEIAIRTDASERRISRDTIRQVAVRRRPLRAAVLIGAGAGAVAGAIAACTGAEREECADAPILAGGVGAGLGLVVGALIHRTTIVYPEAGKRTVVVPVISPNAVGVRIGRTW